MLCLAQRRHCNGLGTCRSSCTSAFAREKILETFTTAQECFGTKKPSFQIYRPSPHICNRSIKKEHFSLKIIAKNHLTPLVSNKTPFFPSFPAVTVFYRAMKTMRRKAGSLGHNSAFPGTFLSRGIMQQRNLSSGVCFSPAMCHGLYRCMQCPAKQKEPSL